MADVSRETPPPAPPVPDEVRGVFPVDRVSLIVRYAEFLAADGVVRGLIGPRETPRLWERHILNSAVVEELVPPGASVADIGSGAGLPGIPLAICRPDVTVTLIEPLLRRSVFLEEVVHDLQLDNVRVLRARAEDVHGLEELRPGFDVVTSRAVAPLDRLLGWSLPLVSPTGAMVALKGSNAEAEASAVAPMLRRWGCAPADVHELGVGRVPETTHAVRVAWSDAESVAWPPTPVVERRPHPRVKSARKRR